MSVFDLGSEREAEESLLSEEEEESPDRGEGQDSSGDPPDADPLRAEIAELKRRDREREEQMTRLVAQNTILQSQVNERANGEPEKKAMSPSELKAWAESEEGDPVSASVHYTDEKVQEIERRIEQKAEEKGRKDRLVAKITKTLPDLANPESELSRELNDLADRYFSTGVGASRDEAYVAALVQTAAARGAKTVIRDPEPAAEHMRRRRVESSAGTGASAQGPPSGDLKLTEDDLKLAAKYGLKDVFDDDPKKRKIARKLLLEEKLAEQERSGVYGRYS